jgi:hypothetical protein
MEKHRLQFTRYVPDDTMNDAADQLKTLDNNVEKLGKSFDAQLAITVAAALDGRLQEALTKRWSPSTMK